MRRLNNKLWGRRRFLLLLPTATAFCLATARAGQSSFIGRPEGSLLTAGSKGVMILSPEGKVTWEFSTGLTHDAWALASGNILFADGDTVTEVTREHKVVWRYEPQERKGGGAYACQRLPNGNTMVGENSTGRILEVNPAGQIVAAVQTSPCKPGDHHNLRMVRKLENGNYLACHSGARLVKEYSPTGQVVWEWSIPGKLAFAAIRTGANTTLVSSLDEVREYDQAGRVVWECKAADLEGAAVRNMTGMHLLANGNLVVGCYQAYANGQGSGLLEFTRARKVVWRYANPAGESTMMPVQLLSPGSQLLPGPLLR
jgi:hypothetical protein